MKHANVAIFVPHVGCPNQCSFCNQHSISGAQAAPSPLQVTMVCQQALEQLGERAKESEIAFFGGSFTAIERSYMESLLQAAAAFVGKDGFAGIRISTRPDAIDREILHILSHYGVTAVELGAQSMNNRVLALNERGHTAQQVRDAAWLIKVFGLSLGLQMMVGLYGEHPEDAVETAQELIALNPDTVRIYPTVVVKGTLLAKLTEQGLYQPLSIQSAVAICAQLLDLFEQANIKIIRLGLHASELLEQEMIGGPYHPAFGELCQSERFYQKGLCALQNAGITGGQALLFTAPSNLSKLIGQKRRNIERYRGAGFTVKVIADNNMLPQQVIACPA